MALWPARGLKPWDKALRAYVDEQDALARNADNLTSGSIPDARIPAAITRDSELTAAIAAALAGNNVGRELGYIERLSNFTTMNTTLGSNTAKISTLSITVVGEGRPVDIEGFFPNNYVNSANVGYGIYILQDNTFTRGFAVGVSPSTAFGPGRIVKARRVLTLGQSYTFEVGAYTISGTLTMAAGSAGNIDTPMYLSVVGR